MDNEIYGFTRQASPTQTRLEWERKSSPYGTVETPLNPMLIALASACRGPGRGFSSKPKELIELIKKQCSTKGLFVPASLFAVRYLSIYYDHFKKRSQALAGDQILARTR